MPAWLGVWVVRSRAIVFKAHRLLYHSTLNSRVMMKKKKSGEPRQERLGVLVTPHRAHPEGCVALRFVLVTVPRVSRSCEHFPDGFNLHFLQCVGGTESGEPRRGGWRARPALASPLALYEVGRSSSHCVGCSQRGPPRLHRGGTTSPPPGRVHVESVGPCIN